MRVREWDKSLSVNVSLFDEQHKILFSLIKIFDIRLKDGKGKSALKETLEALLWYTKVHFKEEEMKLVEKGYPYIEEHRKEHEDLEAKVRNFQKEITSGQDRINVNYQSYVNFIAFINDWLQNHIAKTDKQYASFLNKE